MSTAVRPVPSAAGAATGPARSGVVDSAAVAGRGADAAMAPDAAAIAQAAARDAMTAAMLLAVDPVGLGGARLRGPAGPARKRWLDGLRAALPAGVPWRTMPGHIQDERLIGGLDLTATLAAGRPVEQKGLLAECDGGVLLVSMAERLNVAQAGRLAAVIDSGQCVLERDGLALRRPARFAAIALDESRAPEEQVPPALVDRLAFSLAIEGDTERALMREPLPRPGVAADVATARLRLPRVQVPDAMLQAVCGTALVLGIDSLRVPLLALRAVRASAAWAGREVASDDDAALAARLVLGPRATRLPPADEAPDAEPPPEPPPPESAEPPSDPPPDEADPPQPPSDAPLDDVVLAAAAAAIPPGLLAALQLGPAARARHRSSGRAGVARQARWHGRPIGSRRGELRGGARLNLLDTLRAAAPWQGLRKRAHDGAAAVRPAGAAPPPRVAVRPEDFRITRYKQRSETTTIFVVDASGSAALHRLAEAKGAIELLLADCYVRRDRVAMVAFRGRTAELLLPPTRSLVRAKRSLSGLPGGGGTPLAAAIDTALAVADQVQRSGATPVLVMLTDGRANVGRDGAGGREQAMAQALEAATALRVAGHATLLLDTSAQPQAAARQLAAAMGAAYLPLPFAGAAAMSQAVRTAVPGPRG